MSGCHTAAPWQQLMEELGKFVSCPKRERDIDKKLDQLIKVSATNVTIKIVKKQ